MTKNFSINVSIIIEWENALLSEADRAILMLKRLRRQISQSDRSIEVILVFDDEQVERSVLEEAIEQSWRAGGEFEGAFKVKNNDDWRIEAVSGMHYYQIKNAGAQMARGDIIVFLDSDVVPDEGWLAGLIEPMLKDSAIDVMAGNTYLDPENLVGKAFALGWFFPLKNQPPGELTQRTRFFANNVAFRRSFFSEFNFPEMPPGVTRGACTELAKTLIRHGITIHSNPMAQTSHPSPNGLNHLWIRALASGRDRLLQNQSQGWSRIKCIQASAVYCTQAIQQMWRRTTRQGHCVGLLKYQYPQAILLMMFWHTLSFVGAAVTMIAPTWAGQRWRI